MLRSFDYAANAGLLAYTEGRPRELERLAPWARTWEAWTSAMFLRNYLAVARDAPFIPRPAAHLSALLDAYLLDRAAHELRYELASRPQWAGIPIGGMLRLLRW
jgi:maltose alpha-D-glucosyltransferase/alpha-amylase